jgi:hypothetical protein
VPVPEDVRQEFAGGSLVAAVEKMRERLRVSRDTGTIVAEVKQTMRTQLPSHGLTVFQVLYERERQDAFNKEAVDEFPEFNREFKADIRDFMIARDGRAAARKVHQLAGNVWREDAAADRRAREKERSTLQKDQPQRSFRSPFRAQPELYDREVVSAFADAIARLVP